MLITKTIEIDMGHRVPNHKSKCRNLHGHRYKIEVGVDDKVVTTTGTSDEGMVIDFSDLKQIMANELDAEFDHGFVISESDELFKTFAEIKLLESLKIIFVSFIPTAENLAKLWYHLLKKRLDEINIKIKHVTVWETPTSTATFKEE